jgi:flagellin-like protein
VAVSPIIATIILIAITVSLSLVLYGIVTSTVRTASTAVEMEVSYANLVQSSAGATVFAITLKNTGSVPVDNVTVILTTDSSNTTNVLRSSSFSPDPSLYAIAPSQAASSVDTSLSGGFTIGNSYSIIVEAATKTGGSFSTVLTVACEP